MMLHIVLPFFCVLLMPMATSLGHELVPIGTLPELGVDWELSLDDQRTERVANLPFHWAVFRHKESGDFLSFAALSPEPENGRGLEFWSDTALEIFPNGRPVWIQGHTESTSTVLDIKTVSLKGHEVLKYCLVSESPGRDNLMAHGCVWVCKNGIVFVQHTSARPITPAVAQDAISKLFRSQREDTVPKSQ